MIEVNDIRAGNMVKHDASGIIVTILRVENNTVLLETFPQNSYCACTDISGITLTSSLLKRLSFTNEDEADKWSGAGLSIHAKPDGFFYGLRITKSRAKLQYLHQLQNYVEDYYALFMEISYSLNINTLKEIEMAKPGDTFNKKEKKSLKQHEAHTKEPETERQGVGKFL